MASIVKKNPNRQPFPDTNHGFMRFKPCCNNIPVLMHANLFTQILNSYCTKYKYLIVGE